MRTLVITFALGMATAGAVALALWPRGDAPGAAEPADSIAKKPIGVIVTVDGKPTGSIALTPEELEDGTRLSAHVSVANDARETRLSKIPNDRQALSRARHNEFLRRVDEERSQRLHYMPSLREREHDWRRAQEDASRPMINTRRAAEAQQRGRPPQVFVPSPTRERYRDY